jgi:Winged helix DNA-binding domain
MSPLGDPLSLRDVTQARLRNQRLVGPPFARAEEVVRWLGAVQAQDYAGAKWAIGQRVKDCVDDDVERAFRDGRILRTHVMRPTWHFVMPEDLRWMLALTAPRVRAAMAYYDRKLDLTDRVFGRSHVVIAKALQGGRHLTREELGRVLAGAGIQAAGQRLGHLMMRAELDAVICSGPRRGKQFTYALLDDRAPAARKLTRNEALGELTARYFASHGPALPQDLAWWSGLTVADVRRGIDLSRSRLSPAVVAGATHWFAPARRAAKVQRTKDQRVHLLPNYDEYLIAYKNRSAAAAPEVMRKLVPGDDLFANHFVVLDGRLVGGWRRLQGKKIVIVEIRLLVPLAAAARKALHDTAARYAAFLGVPVQLSWQSR